MTNSMKVDITALEHYAFYITVFHQTKSLYAEVYTTKKVDITKQDICQYVSNGINIPQQKVHSTKDSLTNIR
jgi:hypothetical protein